MKWQPVIGWPHYEVSSCGKIRKACGDEIGQWKNQDGYMLVRVARPRAMLRVHRVVAEAFIPNPLGYEVINHIDANPENNKVENLQWCTQAQNIAHADKLGRMQRQYWKGKRSPNAQLSDVDVASIRDEYLLGKITYAKLATKYKTSKRTIGRIIRGVSYV